MNISEIFCSIEGEGIEIGRPEVFIRLSKCNLKCVWCDTKYALDNGQEMSVNDIINEIGKNYHIRSVSITGGEPLLQSEELLPLVTKLKKLGYWLTLNTNGTIFDKIIFEKIDLLTVDCKCPSSTMESNIEVIKKVRDNFSNNSQFKFVISDENDYNYAKQVITSLFKEPSNLVFQPLWENRTFSDKLVKLVIADNLKVRIILQQHKFIWGEKKGV